MLNWIKGFFSTQPIGSPLYQEMRRNALKELAANRPQHAMLYLASFLNYSEPPAAELDEPAVWRDAMRLFAKAADAMNLLLTEAEPANGAAKRPARKLATLLKDLGDNPDDAELLVALSSVMIEYEAAGIGAMFLARAARIVPTEYRIRDFLALTLMNQRNHVAAANALRSTPAYLENHPSGQYILARALLWQGDSRGASAQWRLALPPTNTYEQQQYEQVEGFLQRVDAYETLRQLDGRDLRGWHFVLTGGILLHCSPFGSEVMNGRYGMLFDHAALQLECIQRVAALLKACDKPISTVFALPDQASQILATATARYLGCPVQPWPPAGTNEAGLIVAYALADIGSTVGATLAVHQPGQIFWAHICSWQANIPVAPDLVSLLAEHNLSPWSEQRANYEGSAPRRTGSIEALAEEILAAPLAEDALTDLADLCQWVALLPALAVNHAPGIARDHGLRQGFYADSPVPSNSFRGLGRQ